MAELVTDRKAQRALFVVMAMAFLLDGLDGTIVTIALPEIAEEFGMGTGESSWVVTVYFMAMAGLILVFGKLADMGWIKKILITGFVVFALSSLACGFSTGIVMLLIFRAVQGIGSAMLAATGIMLVVRFLPIQQRHFGMSLSVLGSSLGAAFGPVLGGVLTDLLNWNWIFYINVPVGLLCALFSVKAVPKDDPLVRAPFDHIGSVLLFLALICGLYCVEALPSDGFTMIAAAAFASFAVLFAVFMVYERRPVNPVLDLGLFRLPKFDLAVTAFMAMNACFMGLLYLIPFLLKIELGYDTITSGLLILIQAVVTLIICLPVGRACDNYGTRGFAVLGCTMMAVSFAILLFTNASTGIVMAATALAVMGTVWGFCGASLGPRLVENVPEEKNGSASSLLSFFVYFGSAFGTALFSALFNVGSGSSGRSIADLSAPVFMDGFVFAMICGAVISAAAALISWYLKDERKV